MKKNLFVLLFTILSFSVSAQYFDGVKIEGGLEAAVSKFKAKGYILKNYIEGGVGASMEGKILNTKIELLIFVTPKTKQVFKAVIYMPKENDWSEMKSEYQRYFNVLRDKYGIEDNKFDFFKKPYYEGDGYEMSAVANEKAVFAAYWINKDNCNIAVSISKYQQVEITYENVKWIEIAGRERDDINNTKF